MLLDPIQLAVHAFCFVACPVHGVTYIQVERKVEEVLQQDKLEAIVCVAGGWAGGNAASASVSLT